MLLLCTKATNYSEASVLQKLANKGRVCCLYRLKITFQRLLHNRMMLGQKVMKTKPTRARQRVNGEDVNFNNCGSSLEMTLRIRG